MNHSRAHLGTRQSVGLAILLLGLTSPPRPALAQNQKSAMAEQQPRAAEAQLATALSTVGRKDSASQSSEWR